MQLIISTFPFKICNKYTIFVFLGMHSNLTHIMNQYKWERPTRCTAFLTNLFQLDYPLHNRVKKCQLDAQLILNIFLQHLHISGVSRPSSGGTTVCIQQLVLIILFRWMSVVLVGQQKSFIKNNKYHFLYTYSCTSWWWPRYARNM